MVSGACFPVYHALADLMGIVLAWDSEAQKPGNSPSAHLRYELGPG